MTDETPSDPQQNRNLTAGFAAVALGVALLIHHITAPEVVFSERNIANQGQPALQAVVDKHKTMWDLTSAFYGVVSLGFAGAAVKNHRAIKSSPPPTNPPSIN